MKSRVPPGDIDIDSYGEGSPTRPADVSLGQWLSARMATPEEMRSQPAVAHQPMAPRDRDDIAAIHRQLDGITEQIERLSQRRQSQARHSQTYAHEAAEAARPAAGPTVADTPGLADRLNDAISRLDKRLANMARPPAADVAAARRTEAVDRAAAQLYHKDGYQPVLPPGRTGGIDSAIAEISARHRELNSGAPAESRPAAQPRRSAPEPLTPPSPNLTSLEKQLHLITAQIETLVGELDPASEMLLRIALARIEGPEMLCIDDFDALLSPTERALVAERLRELAAHGVRVVVATSDPSDAALLATTATIEL